MWALDIASLFSLMVGPVVMQASDSPGSSETGFALLFPELPPWTSAGETEEMRRESLRERSTGMEADPEAPLVRSANRSIPAGYTYVGQFLAHDISFDPRPAGESGRAPRNFRTPALDLDHVYGRGPTQQPYLWEPAPTAGDRAVFLVGSRHRLEDWGEFVELDLPRNVRGQALVPDPRNDTHVLVRQIHLAVLLFHNRCVAELQKRDIVGHEAYREARRMTTWHYQWAMIHDYLAKIVGRREVARAFQRARSGASTFCGDEEPLVPLEFSVGAFRFGHSMVQGKYELNDCSGPVSLLPFDHGRPFFQGVPLAPRRTVCWDRFFEIEGSRNTQYSRLLKPSISDLLRVFPGRRAEESSLAMRDFTRSQTAGVPSGQDVAKSLGFLPVQPSTASDPLWYYVLREAFELEEGRRLGPVGGRIISDVLLGLLWRDPDSYLHREPNWEPSALARGARFVFSDFLRFAGMPMVDADLPWN